MDDAAVGRERRWSAWRILGGALATLAFAAVALPVVARAAGWEGGVLPYVVALCPWVVIASAVPLLLALVSRTWLVAAATLLVAIVAAWWMVPLYIGGSGGDTALTVATVNLAEGAGDAQAVAALVRDQGVDLLAVQELTPEAERALEAAGLDQELPYSATEPEAPWAGTGLWARMPLSDAQTLEGFTFHQVRATVELESGPVTVLAAHPAAPQIRGGHVWADEQQALVDLVASLEGPLILAGDLNATRDHAAFRDLEAAGLTDAPDAAGSGFAPTFPEGLRVPPLAAIDHVLTREVELRATDVAAHTIPGSDHRALVVTYAAG